MAQSTTLQLGRDKNGFVTYELPWCEDYYEVTLAAGVAQSITVPSNVKSAFFSFSAPSVFVQLNGAAIAVPTGTFASVKDKAFNPGARHGLVAGDVLQFISATAADVGVEFYNKKLGTV